MKGNLSMIELIAVATITILAVISPGADFAMVTRNSLLHGRRAGLLASLGIATGVQLHVLYSMLGVALLIQQSPQWFDAIKLAGAVYLVYVGYQTVRSQHSGEVHNEGTRHLSPLAAWRTGFFTNALNPKTTLFVVSVYTQVVQPGTSLTVQIGYGLFMSLAHWVWFSLVTVLFSEPRLRNRMLVRQVVLNRCIGGVLIALGLSLALASAASQ
jgi:RhtB (resistance to homoserine/threonine) family protein